MTTSPAVEEFGAANKQRAHPIFPTNPAEHAEVAPYLDRSGINRSIFRAAGAVALAGVLVKVAATAKEFVVASRFGRSDAMDAFLIAFLVPGLLVNLFAESMNQALIPTLIRVRAAEGRVKAQELLSSAMSGTGLLLLAGSAVMAIGARTFFPLFLSHFSTSKVQLTEALFYGLLPVVVLGGIASNCAAVLNTVGRFTLPALAPIMTPMTIVAAAWLLAGRFGIWALVLGNVGGGLVQACLMGWMMHTHGYAFRLRWFGFSDAMREVAGQYGPVLLSGLVASGGLLVDQAMAAMLGSGSVATLAYANRFAGVLLMLMAGAISTALTPHFGELVARQDGQACRHAIKTWVAITACLSIPVAAALMLGSSFLIRLTFQHGAFGPQDTAFVSPVQTMYALQLPFFVVSRVYYRYLLAVRKASLILVCGVMNLVLDVFLNLILMRWLGVAGIALATSLWTASTCLFLGYWAYRFLPPNGQGTEKALGN